MAVAIENVHHQINYVEVSVTNLGRAKQFYRAAFGWEFNDYGPEYAGIRKHDGVGEVGGLAVSETVEKGGPLLVLFSSDLEQSARSVVDAGGKLVGDTITFPGGRRFQFADPDGNELAVWTDKMPDGSTCES